MPIDDGNVNGGTPSTILVVEPDILVRMVIASYLRDCGYKVLEGVSAADALAVLGSGQQIDFVLSEVRLRGKVNGFALAHMVREQYPNVDVILTSSVTRAADKARNLCEESPLEKPYEPHEVVRRINLLRERRRTAPSPEGKESERGGSGTDH
jgi:DNA-binding response OmpR family regulator